MDHRIGIPGEKQPAESAPLQRATSLPPEGLPTPPRLPDEVERYFTLVEQLPAILYISNYGPEGRAYFISPKIQELLGFAPKDWMDHPHFWIERMHPDDRERAVATEEAALQEGKTLRCEYRLQHRDGTYRWFRDEGVPIQQPKGQPLLHGVLYDIQESKEIEQALSESESRYRGLFENNILGHLIATEDGRILECNDKVLEIFGFRTKEEMKSVRTTDLYADPTDREHLLELLRTKNAVQNLELRNKRKDGSVIWCAHSVRRVVHPITGQATLHSTTVDISERKHAETKLRESEERARMAMRAASMGAWEWIAATNVTVWDENFSRLIGLAGKDMPGSPEGVLQYIVPEDREKFLNAVKRCSETGERYGLEFRIRRPDGEIRWIADQGRATLDENGKVVRFRGVAQDITDRRQSERALHEMQERLHLALDTAELGMWEWRPETDAFYLDERECKLLGVTPGHAPKTTAEFIQNVHPDDRGTVLEAVRTAFRTGESAGGEVRVRMPDGKYRWLSSTGRVVRDASGKIEVVRGITLDMTHRRKLEEQLRLAQRMEAIGLLAGGVAHDFNNLLTVIRGHTELILEIAGANQDLQRNATAVQEAANRAASITQQLLAFSRRQTLQPRVLDLNHIVTNSGKLLRRLIQANIALDIETVAEPLWIKADASQLEQVLMNLVVNSRDAMPSGGRVILQTKRLPAKSAAIRNDLQMPDVEYAHLTVSDTGAGMDAETQAHVFDPFFTTKEPGKGTGLGLSMVYGIVKQSSGWVFVESEIGKGTRFHLYFPLTEAGTDSESAKPAAPPKPVGKETILIAEDQEAVRELAAEYLASLGYSVLAVEDGQNALALAEKQNGTIHLLLTDAMMPGMSGSELSRKLRQSRPDIKVLYISGYANEVAELENLSGVTEAFLQKPFSMSDLALKIRSLLG